MRFLYAAMVLFLAGCGPVIVKHPDAPMLIIEARGRARVAVETTGENKKLIEYGWVELEEGWTLVKYDWEE